MAIPRFLCEKRAKKEWKMGTNLVKSGWEGNGYPSLLVRKAGKKGMENARFSVKFIY